MTTQRRDSTPNSGVFNHRFFLLGGLGWLGSLGLLSAGMALAQTPDSSAIQSVPSAQELLQSDAQIAAPAPVSPAPAPVQPPSSDSLPSVSTELQQSTSGNSTTSVAPSPDPVPGVNSIGTENADLDNGTGASSPLVAPNLSEKASAAFNSNYIDKTPYSVGATQVDNPDITFSENSTGCQITLSANQSVPGSICPPPPPVPASPIAGSGSSGGYSSVTPSISLSYGIGPGSTTPSGRDYYNLTLRPPAQLGNGNISLLFPLSIPAAITSVFGWRIHPIMGSSRFHSGTDLGAPQGTPVLAAFGGKVAIADLFGGYGLTVVLQHDKGKQETLYAHLSEVFVRPGETVKQGDVIGRVGSTGLSTGPHLHFEFRQQTPAGWIVMDPGQALQYAMAQLIRSLQVAQVQTTTRPHNQ